MSKNRKKNMIASSVIRFHTCYPAIGTLQGNWVYPKRNRDGVATGAEAVCLLKS